jgi:hypothetical protein
MLLSRSDTNARQAPKGDFQEPSKNSKTHCQNLLETIMVAVGKVRPALRNRNFVIKKLEQVSIKMQKMTVVSGFFHRMCQKGENNHLHISHNSIMIVPLQFLLCMKDDPFGRF